MPKKSPASLHGLASTTTFIISVIFLKPRATKIFELPIKKWHEWIGDPTAADAILDRVVHNAFKVELTGPSRRKEKKA
jgi:DNA replication protein DnaC